MPHKLLPCFGLLLCMFFCASANAQPGFITYTLTERSIEYTRNFQPSGLDHMVLRHKSSVNHFLTTVLARSTHQSQDRHSTMVIPICRYLNQQFLSQQVKLLLSILARLPHLVSLTPSVLSTVALVLCKT